MSITPYNQLPASPCEICRSDRFGSFVQMHCREIKNGRECEITRIVHERCLSDRAIWKVDIEGDFSCVFKNCRLRHHIDDLMRMPGSELTQERLREAGAAREMGI